MSLFDAPAGPAGRQAPRPRPRVRVRMVIAYDGSGFHGFAANAGVRTVAGSLTESLEQVLRQPVELACAGRTDAGVHAWGQVVSFDASSDGLDLAKVQRSLNGLCAPTIVVRELSLADPSFHARHSAVSRRYRYTILNRPVPDPFLASTSWHIPEPLDLSELRLACDPLVGEHDFTSFCRRPRTDAGSPSPSLVRRVLDARWVDAGGGVLRFEIEASAFCHQMVRSIVGTLVDVGRGRLRAGELLAILRRRDRAAAGQPAPAHGLCLWAVRYPDTPPG
ncbi:MAG: tRNA pseudouridine(38-40) synthase TruA [Acidimicrobiales bacterium]|nr:tRNA pseudouridine(38-40) synthase TruA [Acidimicrobiales bacterium]